MPGKLLTNVVRHFFCRERRRCFLCGILAIGGLQTAALAEQTDSTAPAPRFLGSQSCSSSSCHGGASEKSDQYTIWSTHDFHHARPYATLETARSERLAEVLKIGNAAQSPRCTVCHAPFATVPGERLGHDAKATEGVSCETCHGPAENWIRSHTRPDYTHADRVAAGMRDLKSLYVRANTCVACHQNIDPEIRAAGHPELIFELDGQSVTMPKHWREETNWNGARTWLVGQAVALREMSWQLAQQPSSPDAEERWEAMMWLLQPAAATRDQLSQFPERLAVKAPNAGAARKWSDGVASAAADLNWSDRSTARILLKLSKAGDQFFQPFKIEIHARRAERLVLALDRLSGSLEQVRTNTAANESLSKLFADAQSMPDFDPTEFAKDLNTFHSSVAGILETK